MSMQEKINDNFHVRAGENPNGDFHRSFSEVVAEEETDFLLQKDNFHR